jgi:hypothetical protein
LDSASFSVLLSLSLSLTHTQFCAQMLVSVWEVITSIAQWNLLYHKIFWYFWSIFKDICRLYCVGNLLVCNLCLLWGWKCCDKKILVGCDLPNQSKYIYDVEIGQFWIAVLEGWRECDRW